ncbi:MAG: PD40 domain-containing protein, partial [Anaerolineales bacterium]|nr:PD40 domain-containing protein [Anaerolineales bacterium]
MTKPTLTEKYESNGWPSIARPDLKPPAGWSLPLLSAVNRVRNHALAPDGETIAFIWDREDQSDIYTLRPGSWPQRLTFDRQPIAYWSDGTPAWSPDGQWLAYGANGHIWVVPADGRGLPTKISGFATGASSPVWLPDSHGLIMSIEHHDAGQLLLSDREGSWPRPLVTRRDGDCWEAASTADGEWAVYTFRPFDDLRRTDIQMVHLTSGRQETVAGWPQVVCQQPEPAPTDERIAFVSQKSGWLEIWLATTSGSEPRQLTRFHADVGYFAWSPNGRQLVATVNQAGSYHLVLIDAETGAAQTLLAGDGYHSRPNWSPDGSWLTVEYEDPLLPPDIYRISLAGERR